jgi:hypothetical protein
VKDEWGLNWVVGLYLFANKDKLDSLSLTSISSNLRQARQLLTTSARDAR